MKNLALRTVSETEDFRVIEGLGIPFGGAFKGNRDSYGTRATPKTDFAWGLYPDDSKDPQYVRPLTYKHGFDPEIGLARIGGWTPLRTDKWGVWVQAQIDKRQEYYRAIAPLLDHPDGPQVGFSSSTAEHWADIDARTGDWKTWPALELALTPTESNPYAQISARSAEATNVLIRVTSLRATNKKGEAIGPPEGGKPRDEIPDEDFAGPDKSYPIVDQDSVDSAASLIGKAADPAAVKAKVIAIASRKGLKIPDAWQARSAFRQAADDVSCATDAQRAIAYLMECESDESDQLADLRAAFDAISRFITAEAGEIGTDADEPEENDPAPAFEGYYSAMSAREGRRNSTSDQAHVDAIHDHATALGATAHAGVVSPDDQSHQGDPAMTGDRSAGRLPTVRIMPPVERLDAKAIRQFIKRASSVGAKVGSEVGADAVRRLRTG